MFNILNLVTKYSFYLVYMGSLELLWNQKENNEKQYNIYITPGT